MCNTYTRTNLLLSKHGPDRCLMFDEDIAEEGVSVWENRKTVENEVKIWRCVCVNGDVAERGEWRRGNIDRWCI